MPTILYKPGNVALPHKLHEAIASDYNLLNGIYEDSEHSWQLIKNEAIPGKEYPYLEVDSPVVLFFSNTSGEYIEPFFKKWDDDNWIYVVQEGYSTTLATSFSWKELKTLLAKLSYEGAVNLLKFINQRKNKNIIYVTSGVINVPDLSEWSTEDGNYTLGHYRKSKVTPPPVPHVKSNYTSTSRNEETVVFEGIVFKKAGPGLCRHFNTECKVYIDRIIQGSDSYLGRKLFPLDFVVNFSGKYLPSLEEIRDIAYKPLYQHTLVLHRWKNLNRKEAPETLTKKFE